MYILWTIYALQCLSFSKEFEKNIVQIIFFGSITISTTVIVILSCFTLTIVDFANITFLVIRAIVALALFNAISNKNAGFEQLDVKPMYDCI